MVFIYHGLGLDLDITRRSNLSHRLFFRKNKNMEISGSCVARYLKVGRQKTTY